MLVAGADMAKAFIEAKDAVKDKTAMYLSVHRGALREAGQTPGIFVAIFVATKTGKMGHKADGK